MGKSLKQQRILTINRHSTFLSPLIDLGGKWTVIEYFAGERTDWTLDKNIPNVNFTDWSIEIENEILAKKYSLFLIHTVRDLWKIRKFADSISIVMVLHIALYKHNLKFLIAALFKWLIVFYMKKRYKIDLVCISDWKKSTWGFKDVEVIRNIPADMPQSIYTLEPKALLIGNHLDNRDEVDFSLFQKINAKTQVQLFGKTTHFNDAIELKGRKHYCESIMNYQIVVYIMQRPFEDGFNMGLLDAMRAGLAVVTIDNPSTLVENGLNGFVCKTVEEMIEKIEWLKLNPEECHRMGLKSQEKILKEFSSKIFNEKWCKVLKLS